MSNEADHTGEVRCGVAVIIINEDGHLLFQRRHPDSPHQGGTWSAPGGLIEFGETLEQAARREAFEEHAIALPEDPAEYRRIWVSSTVFSDGRHSVTAWLAVNGHHLEPTVVEPTKHTDVRWFDPESLPGPLFASYPEFLAGPGWKAVLEMAAERRTAEQASAARADVPKIDDGPFVRWVAEVDGIFRSPERVRSLVSASCGVAGPVVSIQDPSASKGARNFTLHACWHGWHSSESADGDSTSVTLFRRRDTGGYHVIEASFDTRGTIIGKIRVVEVDTESGWSPGYFPHRGSSVGKKVALDVIESPIRPPSALACGECGAITPLYRELWFDGRCYDCAVQHVRPAGEWHADIDHRYDMDDVTGSESLPQSFADALDDTLGGTGFELSYGPHLTGDGGYAILHGLVHSKTFEVRMSFDWDNDHGWAIEIHRLGSHHAGPAIWAASFPIEPCWPEFVVHLGAAIRAFLVHLAKS